MDLSLHLKFERRLFNGTSFGERQDVRYGTGLDGFEDYVSQFTDDPDDEPARPFDRIVAGRQWVDADGEWSEFAYRDDSEGDER